MKLITKSFMKKITAILLLLFVSKVSIAQNDIQVLMDSIFKLLDLSLVNTGVG